MGLFSSTPRNKAYYEDKIADLERLIAQQKERLAIQQGYKRNMKGRAFTNDNAIASIKADIERKKGELARLRAEKAKAPK